MHPTCAIDHSLDSSIPRDLCRGCHPELNVRADANAKPNVGEQAADRVGHRELSFQASIAA